MTPFRLRYPLIVGALMLVSHAGWSQVSTEYRNQTPEPLDERLIADTNVDTTGVWYHIQQNQKQLANDEFGRLKAEFPAWQPDQDLIDAMARLNAAPAKEVAVPKLSRAEVVFGKLANLAPHEWARLPATTVNEAEQLAWQHNLDDYHLLTGWIQLSRQHAELALAHFLKATPGKDANDGISASLTQHINQLAAQQNITQLAALLNDYADYQVAEKVEARAWQAYDAKEFALADQLFALQNNVYAQVLVRKQQGRDEEAQSLACEHTQEPRLLKWCINGLAALQADAFEAQDYPRSLAAADRLQSYAPLTPAQQELQAWALYQSGQNESARQAFTVLLSADPENQVYADTLLKLTPEPEHAALAEQFSLIAASLKKEQAGNGWMRKQFNLAYWQGADVYGADDYREHLQVYAGLAMRQRSGDSGLGQLDVWQQYVGLADSLGQWHWDLQLHFDQLDSGLAEQDSWFGIGQVDDTFDGISKVSDKGIALSLYRQYDSVNVYADLAYGLLDQPVDTSLTGQVSMAGFAGDITWAATAYKAHQTDSLLSTTGTLTEAQDNAWGGVLAMGIKGLLVYSFKPNWAAALSVNTAQFRGENTQDNAMQSARIDINRNIASSVSDNLDYFRVGPYVSWQSYDHNQSGFTLGQGGYFSPSEFTSAGLYAELLTQEAQRWQFKASLNLGYASIKQAAYFRYLTSENDSVEASSDSGVGADLRLEAQRLFGQHWLVAGYIKQAWAIEYNATQAGIQIRWHAGNQSGVTSDTLILSSPRMSGFAL